MFYRLHTDGEVVPHDIGGLYSGPQSSACWIIGGGPSLNELPIQLIRESPCPKFAINLSGTHLLRPNFWTSYDPTARFHKSVYLDPSILKFVHRCRATDLVPETTFKVCDCPATLFFDRTKEIGFHNFPPAHGEHIVDWQDSFIQAVHIAYLLGFRTLYLAGCEMHIRPSNALQQRAAKIGVVYDNRELLGEFLKRCEIAGMSKAEIETLQIGDQYHFAESKPIAAAIQTDFHYFRVAQYLRLCRRSLTAVGLRLISATPNSRLNDDFAYQSVASISASQSQTIGDPADEQTVGRYTTDELRKPSHLGPMRDFRPHFWGTSPPNSPVEKAEPAAPLPIDPGLEEIIVDICENPE